MNILMVYQSVIDMCASFMTLLTALVEVDGTHMSPTSMYDQFICHFWLTRQQLWYFIGTSTYGILMTAFDRYTAVVYPVWYNNNVCVFTTATISSCHYPKTFSWFTVRVTLHYITLELVRVA